MPFYAGAGQPINTAFDGAGPVTTSSSGRLRVEPEQLDGAIAVFEGAFHETKEKVRQATRSLQAMAPGRDAVSEDIADAFNRLGYQNADCALAAWEGAVAELRSIVRQLKEAKQTIARADASNASSFRIPE